jgi:hypothetical protein
MTDGATNTEIDRALYDELVTLAAPHVEQSSGLLGILDFEPQKYPAQQHNRHMIMGDVAPIEVMDLIGITVLEGYAGKNALGGFVKISEELMTTERRQAVRNVFRSNKSLYVVTSHSNLIDPAIGLGAVTNPLRREENEHDNFQSGIIINKMLSVLKYRVGEQWMSCMQVLQMLCDRTYLSFPQSETFRNSDAAKVLPKGHIPAYNGKIKAEIAPWLAAGGVVLGVAPTGSTHKPDEKGKVILPKITEGTAKMQTHPNIRVFSLIMELDSPNQFIEAASDSLYQVKRWRGAHRVPRDMARAFNDRAATHDQENPAQHVYQSRFGVSDIPILRRRYVGQESMTEAA